MNNKRHFELAIVLMLGISGVARAQDTMLGRVLDLGAEEGKEEGIGGVQVRVKTPTGREVGKGVTAGDGTYSIRLAQGLRTLLIAEFAKVNYYDYPTRLEVRNLTKPQATVFLAASNMVRVYYTRVGSNIMTHQGKVTASSAFSAVAALPSAEKLLVRETLEARGQPSFVAAFENADQTYAVSRSLERVLSASDFDNVYAKANYPETGQIWLYGGVKSKDKQKEIDALIKPFSADRAVGNGVIVTDFLGGTGTKAWIKPMPLPKEP